MALLSHSRLSIHFFLFLFLSLLLGCDLFSESGPAARYGVERDKAIFLAGGQPQTLDPATFLGGPDSAVGHIFSGLVTLDTSLQVQPDLAAGWEVSADGTLYTFYLRPEATFHDGRPVTAQDVVFSWERATDPALGSDTAGTYLGDMVGVAERLRGEAEHISGARVVDDHTLAVQIDAPKVYFLAKLTYPVAFVVDRNEVAAAGWERRPNGTGPFKLAAWEDDALLILAANEAFYGGRPAVEHVVYLMGAGIPLSLYERGEIDVVGVGGSTLERVQDPNNPLSKELRTGAAMCTTFVGLNTTRSPFDDARVRQAFNLALDREKVIEGLYQGDALAAAGVLPPGMPGFAAERRPYPFDPEKARALLAEAGYDDAADFPPITYTTSGYNDAGAFVAAVITMWEEQLGVEIEVVLLDPYQYYDALYAGNVGHLYDTGWCADYPDPENFLDVLYHSGSRQNIGGFSDAAVDRLLEEARVEPDVARRLSLYAEAETMIVEQAASVFVAHSLSAVLVKPRLEGYVLTPIGVAQWHRVRVTE